MNWQKAPALKRRISLFFFEIASFPPQSTFLFSSPSPSLFSISLHDARFSPPLPPSFSSFLAKGAASSVLEREVEAAEARNHILPSLLFLVGVEGDQIHITSFPPLFPSSKRYGRTSRGTFLRWEMGPKKRENARAFSSQKRRDSQVATRVGRGGEDLCKYEGAFQSLPLPAFYLMLIDAAFSISGR